MSAKKKPNPNQLTMFPELARPIKPKADLDEPQIWFQEMRLLHRLDPDESDNNLIRKITFRAGLNVLWAEPEDPDADIRASGLYADGISGHATGKSLFCRILRYLLDDKNFSTADDLSGIQGEFLELWAVAQIRLNGKTWLVGRALTGPGKDFASSDRSFEQVLTSEQARGNYDTFRSALEQTCGSVVRRLHPTEGWRHLLPWLTRDQEARFSAINAWRDSLSEADNPRSTVQAQHLLMRTVLDLLEPAEFDLRKDLEDWQEIIDKSADTFPEKQRTADRDIGYLRSALQRVPSFSDDLKDLPLAKRKITNHIEVRREALKVLQDTPESDKVRNARETLDSATRNLNQTEERITYLEETVIPDIEERQTKEMLLLDRIRTKGVRDPKRVNDNFCPNSFPMAQERGCVGKPVNGESQVEISELEALAKELEQSLEAKRKEKTTLESRVEHLEAVKVEKQEAFNEVRQAENRETNELQRNITLLETALTQIDQAISSAQAVEALRTKKREAEEQIEKSKEKLTEAKKKTEDRRALFSGIFSDVIGAILGATVSATVNITERGLILNAKRNGNLGGTAFATIKTIAFDIAAIIQSIEGRGKHPRFLIHDGPREGDMARIIYGRLFLLARHIEEAFRGTPPSFQYILTTTTPPPADMREGSDWLLGEPMSGRDKSRKLLKKDY